MGADDPTESDGATANGGWHDRRRQRRQAKRDGRRAEAAAAHDEQYRSERERQRALTEEGNPLDARMRRALTQVRREGYKVALVYAVVDAALVALLTNLVVQVVKPAELPPTLPWPVSVYDAIVRYTGAPPAPLQTAIVAGLVAGVLVFLVEFVARVRRPLVEQFEAANPEIREALRTARDTVKKGRDTEMALALYEDVLARLRQTSSIGLVNVGRVFLTVLVITGVSVATVQVAVVDLDLADFDGNEQMPEQDTSEYEGLQDANRVLGEPEDVQAGEETLNTTLSTQGGGDDGGTSSAAAYDSSGFSGATDVEGQEAGFAEQEQLEDAALIREYNLRIRTEDDDT